MLPTPMNDTPGPFAGVLFDALSDLNHHNNGIQREPLLFFIPKILDQLIPFSSV